MVAEWRWRAVASSRDFWTAVSIGGISIRTAPTRPAAVHDAMRFDAACQDVWSSAFRTVSSPSVPST
jgi:hypothetical protein